MNEANQRTDGWISLVDAAELLAKQIYFDEAHRSAANKARGRITTAVKQGAIERRCIANTFYLCRTKFEQWAAAKWPIFAREFNLSHLALFAERAPLDRRPKRRLFSNLPVFDPDSVRIPDEHEKLKELYLRTRRDLLYTEYRLAHFQAELDELLSHDAAQRRMKSEAGKKGGRGRTK